LNQIKRANQRMAAEILRVEGPEGSPEFVEESVGGGKHSSGRGRHPWTEEEQRCGVSTEMGEQASLRAPVKFRRRTYGRGGRRRGKLERH
jgi:hypothetical protein